MNASMAMNSTNSGVGVSGGGVTGSAWEPQWGNNGATPTVTVQSRPVSMGVFGGGVGVGAGGVLLPNSASSGNLNGSQSQQQQALFAAFNSSVSMPSGFGANSSTTPINNDPFGL